VSSDKVTVILVCGLSLIAAALLAAGLYALFGKPSTRKNKKRKQQIVNGFASGGGILLGIILMASLLACSQIAFGIVQSTRLSRGAALFIVLGSLTLIFSLIGYWAKHVAGLIGYSVWNGILMVISGHLVNNPNILVPRWWSISATVLAFVSALVCVRFTEGLRLNRTDKAALMWWLLAFTFAVDVDSTRISYHRQLGLIAMCTGCLALIAAWWYDRTTTRHPRQHRTGINRTAQHST
jgi:hypothetical protein